MKHNIETPRIPEASKSQNPVFRETHAEIDKPTSITETAQKQIEYTRQDILDKYKIKPEHVLTDRSSDGKRRIRAFSILIHKSDENKRYYNEGHTAHAMLFDEILKKFESEIGVHDVWELNLDEWTTKKGFLDPNQNGFLSFPETHEAIVNTWQDNRHLNGKTDGKIPNWFLSGDSEYKK